METNLPLFDTISNHSPRVCSKINIRLSEKFLSFYEEIIEAQRFFFYIILSDYTPRHFTDLVSRLYAGTLL